MSKRYFLYLLIIFVSIIGGCGGEKTSSDDYCFNVGYLDITASAPLFVAKDLDLFEKKGVCIKTRESASSNQLVNSLAAGRIDYIVETSAVPALALQSKDPGRFFITAASEISPEQPFDAILTRANAASNDLKSLEGKTVAVFPGTTAKNLLSAYLSNNGVDASTINFTPTPPSNWLAAVKTGSAHAAHVYEPAWTIGKNDPDLKQIYGTVYGRQLSPNPQGISMIRKPIVKKYPVLSDSIVSVFDEALSFMKEHPDSTKKALKDNFDLPGNTVSKMNLLYMSQHNKINWKSIHKYVDLLLKVDELDQKPDIEGLKYTND